jgi:N-acetylmuramoyl-L-alanine amidase
MKRFRYSVLRSVNCPAVLVEAAFLSNDAEGKKVATAAYRQRIAESIARGVQQHAVLRSRWKPKNL